MSDINKNVSAEVFRTWDDGYVVRRMMPEDAKIVQDWYCGMGVTPKYDLDTVLAVYPPGHGCYIGEINGEVVASAIRIPWGPNVFYGSLYYVKKEHRRKGYGTRLRDQVAFEYVGKNILVVDAVEGKVAETNKKFGYVQSFKTGRFQGVAKESVGVNYDGKIVKAQDLSFDDVIAYDNKCFVSKDFPVRRAFMEKWINIPGGATYVALNQEGHVVGFGCRRPCLQKDNHQVGPLYAESAHIAEALMQQLCSDVAGKIVTVNIWYPNEGAVAMVKKFAFNNVFEVVRSHVNGDPKEYKEQVYALTSIDVCGF